MSGCFIRCCAAARIPVVTAEVLELASRDIEADPLAPQPLRDRAAALASRTTTLIRRHTSAAKGDKE
ncbi:hypothetical protein [Streptomyces monomycini]|uniref:hypothetical protein n=1 Tax=Streptomyces monomycini TaxID=371720 RepID=UPI0004AA6D35|nr:hypothetical protein [Streptomyces monomycini]